MTTQYTEEQISKVRAVEVEILDYVISVCEEYSIRYSLGYGTLIGAIRHKGFIPWDDDLDIIMPRKDYERFRDIIVGRSKDEYYIHDYYTDTNCTNNFLKVRKKHTTFYNPTGFDNPNMSGIFIDIFPADRVPAGKVGRIIQYCASAVNLLYTRQYTSSSKGIINFGERLLLSMPRKAQISIRNKAEKVKRMWNKNNNGLFVNAATIEECRKYFPENMFESFVDVEFEGKKYKATAVYDGFLKSMYGDYMTLPPENERVWGHSPELLDFEHGYDEIFSKRKGNINA